MGNNAASTLGAYPADLHSNMRAFDKLPKCVRTALADADYNWSARQCYDLLRQKEKHPLAQNARMLAQTIRQKDAEARAREGLTS